MTQGCDLLRPSEKGVLSSSWIDCLRCPRHPQAGRLTHSSHWERPTLSCPQCMSQYPIVDGVVDMLVPGESPNDFLEAEKNQWDEQADRYDEERITDPVYMAGVEAAVDALAPQASDLILDAACGTGLTLRNYLRPGMRVVALDLSLQSLRYLRQKVAPANILFVRGDLSVLPFADQVFDRVVCANAIQQVPRADLRKACVRELARVARPAARVVVTSHNFSIPKQRAGWKKDGPGRGPSGKVHSIYRYEVPEFRELLGAFLEVASMRGAGLPLMYRYKLSPISRRLERLLRRFACCAPWGNMLVGKCRNPAITLVNK